MPVTYKRLWKLLIDLGISKPNFRNIAHISQSTLYKLNRDEYVSLEVIERICRALHCSPNEIFEVKNDEIL